jgi:hypothetical protein
VEKCPARGVGLKKLCRALTTIQLFSQSSINNLLTILRPKPFYSTIHTIHMRSSFMRKKIVHVQTVLFQDDVITLKTITGCNAIKDALSKIAEHYITVVGPLSDEQKNKLKITTGEQKIDAAILKAILTTIR